MMSGLRVRLFGFCIPRVHQLALYVNDMTLSCSGLQVSGHEALDIDSEWWMQVVYPDLRVSLSHDTNRAMTCFLITVSTRSLMIRMF